MAETIEQKHAWLLQHPDHEARFAGEFIAVAKGKIVAHGPVFAEVLASARRQGYEPLMARASGDDVEVL